MKVSEVTVRSLEYYFSIRSFLKFMFFLGCIFVRRIESVLLIFLKILFIKTIVIVGN